MKFFQHNNIKDRMPKTFCKGMPIFVISMLAVPIAWFVVFYVIVNFNSIILAFRSLDGVTETGMPVYKWGFDNFSKFFEAYELNTGDVHVSITNTLKYFALNIFIILPLTYFMAYFLYKKIWGYKFFRVLFYMPSILSAVTMTTLYKNILGGYGPVDEFWKALTGNSIPAFFTSYEWGTPIIMIYNVWVGFGVNMILYTGAMGRIPEDVIEAGILDGITWWRELFQVVTPMVWGTLSTTLTLAFTGLFNSGGPILLLTNGAFKTSTINFYIFNQVYRYSEYAYSASIGLFFTVISVPIVFGFRAFMNKLDPKVEY